jgi:Ca2+-transporting ATPase
MRTSYHTLSAVETIQRLETDREQGLSSEEARARLARDGFNELEPPKRTPLWKTFVMQFNDFMIWVLLAAVAISLFEGQVVEGIAIVSILLINALLGVFQEYRAEQALEALKEMSAPTAMVQRGGDIVSIPAKELVVGDVVLLESGNKIPADGRLIQAGALRCEEAALTGESKPSRKSVDMVADENSSLGDRENMVFSGTSVAVGHGQFVVTGTGTGTEMGHIARLIAETEENDTPLQVELERVGKRIAIMILAIAAMVFVVDLLQGEGLSESLLVAIALAVAAIPEGLPAIVTIALSLGVRQMAQSNAIVKKLHAVETLGSTSFICSDKTGTLTQNVMTVREILVGVKSATVEPDTGVAVAGDPINQSDEALLFDIALSCNDARYDAHGDLIGDPTETALTAAAKICHPAQVVRDRIGEVPFSSDRKRMSTIHTRSEGDRHVYTKGGVDVVLALCDQALIDGSVVALTPALQAQIMEANERLASLGSRTLAFAYRALGANEALEGDHIERGLTYVGVMAMLDPPRPEVTDSIAQCHSAGITVAMITGDHALTARAIAAEVGLPTDTPVVTGSELEALSDDELLEIAQHTYIYARVNPEHKIRIVRALKRHGHIVAMTGDGVNDAPALKAADIGVAMGMVGTDVSREAADMVLADDNFATIVKAVKQGRVVFDNLRKSILFLMSCNMSEVLIVFITALLPITSLLPQSEAAGLKGPALLALQLLWINLVTDSLPALALGIDPGSDRVMQRSPRDPKESILAARTLMQTFWQGLFITIGALVMYYGSALGWFGPTDPAHSQTMLLTVVVLSQLLHAFSFRSSTKSIFSLETLKNKWLIMAAVGSMALHMLIIYVPPLQTVFSTASLDGRDWIEVMLATLIPLILNDIYKLVVSKKRAAQRSSEQALSHALA